jgi:hypothetical protein
MKRPFEVGDRIYGFCNGFFGRDCYDNKICVMANDRYAVFEDLDDGFARVLNFESEESSKEKWGNEDEFYNMTQKWKTKNEDY